MSEIENIQNIQNNLIQKIADMEFEFEEQKKVLNQK